LVVNSNSSQIDSNLQQAARDDSKSTTSWQGLIDGKRADAFELAQ
jgi:hypothetical protein